MLWEMPATTPEELERGLVVFYPGSYNSEWEMRSFHKGLRAAGVDHAIELVHWSSPLEAFFVPQGFLDRTGAHARAEAQRIAEYRAAHPAAPVTLLGFSAGSAMAVMVAEELPEGSTVDSLILVGPGLSRYYELGPALENTSQHIAVYWSATDDLAMFFVETFGTVDGEYAESAATFGFATEHERLIQLSWEPEMAVYGGRGDHTDFMFLEDWIRDYLAPWVATAADEAE